MDDYDAGTAQAWSLVVKGTASEIRATEETLRAMSLPAYPWQPGRTPRFVRIEPTSVTGRRFVVDGGFRAVHGDDDSSNVHDDGPTTA